MKRQLLVRTAGIVLVAMVASISGSGCAVMNPDKARLLSTVENRVWPENKAVAIAASPVLFPMGFIALTLDAFIVQPVSVIPAAGRDTWEINKYFAEAWWQNTKWDERYVLECLLAPFRTAGTVVTNSVATVLTFTGSFILRGFFFPYTEF